MLNFYDKPSYDSISKLCLKCDKFYGLKKNNFLCSKCGNLDINTKSKQNLKILDKINIFNSEDFLELKKFIGQIKYYEYVHDIKSIYNVFGKKINSKSISFECFMIQLYLFQICILKLPKFEVDKEKNFFFITNTKDYFPSKLLSLEQSNNVIDILNTYDYKNKHLISHAICKYTKYFWKIDTKYFHPSTLCYWGNFGEEPFLVNYNFKNRYQFGC